MSSVCPPARSLAWQRGHSCSGSVLSPWTAAMLTARLGVDWLMPCNLCAMGIQLMVMCLNACSRFLSKGLLHNEAIICLLCLASVRCSSSQNEVRSGECQGLCQQFWFEAVG